VATLLLLCRPGAAAAHSTRGLASSPRHGPRPCGPPIY